MAEARAQIRRGQVVRPFTYRSDMIVDVEGVSLHLAHPDQLPVRWVGQEEVMRQIAGRLAGSRCRGFADESEADWQTGVGKTTLAYAAAQRLKQETLHLSGHCRYPAGRFDRDAGDRRRRAAEVRCIALVTAGARGGVAT